MIQLELYKQDSFEGHTNTAHTGLEIPLSRGPDIIMTKYPHCTDCSSTQRPGGSVIHLYMLFLCLLWPLFSFFLFCACVCVREGGR